MLPGAHETTVLLIEDHTLFAETITIALHAEGYEVRRLIPTDHHVPAGRLLAAAARLRADVVLLDLDLGRHGDGGRLVAPLTRAGARVVVVTGNRDEALWGSCLQQGARAVFPKDRPLVELLDLVGRVAARQPVITSDEYHRLVAAWFARRAEDDRLRKRLASLTPREQHVLGELIDGHGIQEIVARSGVSRATVRSHIGAILRKLDVATQLGAVGVAHRVGWRPRP